MAGALPQFAAAMNRAMPLVKRLKAYVKNRRDIQYIAVTWPKLEGLTLVRWHEFVVEDTAVDEEAGNDAGVGRRAGLRIIDGQGAALPGSIARGEQQVPELLPLLHACCFLQSLDLSEFFCFTEHVVEAVTFVATAGMRAAATAEWDARRREGVENERDRKGGQREVKDGRGNGGTLAADGQDESSLSCGQQCDANKAMQGGIVDGREGEREAGEKCSGDNDGSAGSSCGGCDGGFDLNVDPREQTLSDEALQVHHSAAIDRMKHEAHGHLSSHHRSGSDSDGHCAGSDAGTRHPPWGHSIWTPATLMFGCSSLVPSFPLSHPPLHALTHLDLLKLSPSAFTHRDVCALALSLPSLLSFRCLCDFDPRVADCVRDETLIAIAASCMHLQRLHLSDCVAWAAPPLSDAPDELDALVTPAGILAMASGLASLHSLTVTPSHNIRGGEAVLLELMSVSPQLREVHVGRLICSSLGANESLDLPPSLSAISLAQCSSLPPSLLPTLALCCPALAEVAFWSCPDLTPAAVEKLCAARRGTLRRVTAVNCHHLPTTSLLRALQPVQAALLSLCCSLDWRQPAPHLAAPSAALSLSRPIVGAHRTLASSPAAVAAAVAAAVGRGGATLQPAEQPSVWPSLESLELMAPLGALLTPLADSPLLNCPRLSTVKVRVHGDCRLLAGPGARAFGLSSLQRHARLRALHLDLGGVVGHSLSCPPGSTDVMTWERFFLHGLPLLPACEELHYVPPADCDLGRRSISLPSAGILASCAALRRLYLHCSASEHLLSLLLRQVGGGAGGGGAAAGHGGTGAGGSGSEERQPARAGHLRDLCIINDSFPASRDDAATGIRAMALQRLLAEVDGRGWQH